jgi:hypothetical protein
MSPGDKRRQELAADEIDGHQLVVRDVSRTLWRQVRMEALARGQTAGALLNEIIREWLARRQG